ncbi:MAG TPA: DEAD/DEAH box helicase family protein [Fibrobacteraceae bacterium]|nr:DEAD/DEAH box helicase family protein [Fibrobacteraceae bacterium]
MNRQGNSIASRLSLRAPQREALEILDRLTEMLNFKGKPDVAEALQAIANEYPGVRNFERDFPSLCFALATGVGKTRLMGAFIAYLHLAHEHRNFFVLAPNLTIYNKLITDFTPNTPKYVFAGIAEFAINPPQIITGDDYDRPQSSNDLFGSVRINIFNISKINSEVRGGKSPRIKRLSEYIGESYFEYLAKLDDLVLLMDESHRYRASAGVRAINELKPVLGLELTATPFVESGKGPIPFQNVIQDYPLARAMADGFVKEPAVVTRENFSTQDMTAEEIERIKLEDGIRLHEATKVELETYARNTGERQVKPFMLVIARDTSHAADLLKLMESDDFFEGRYQGKVIQVDSSKTGAEEDVMIQRLLAVEKPEEPTEVVIHVNMLKEGWDVTNLYTIVPLRAANARTLIEQSIGRGLRLPYGKRTGVKAVDRLSIVAHDRFQEIVDEANSGSSVIRMQTLVLTQDDLQRKPQSVVSNPILESLTADSLHSEKIPLTLHSVQPLYQTEEERKIAAVALDVAQSLSTRPDLVPTVEALHSPAVLQAVQQQVEERLALQQLELDALVAKPDVTAIVQKTLDLVVQHTIPIPRIVVVPRGHVKAGFASFSLSLHFRYPPPSEDLLIQELRTRERQVISASGSSAEEARLEDYIVRALVDFDDICYDDHADLLYNLAGQVIAYCRTYLSSEDDIRKVLVYYQTKIADLIHVQMQEHAWEEATEYETRVTAGFTPLKKSAYSVSQGDILDVHEAPKDKSNMGKYLFQGFARCLYSMTKFDSDPERRLALILDRESLRWFRPANGQFQIYYGRAQQEYHPDFVAETDHCIYMLEPKARDKMTDKEVLEKAKAAQQWCDQASEYSHKQSGKPWKYLLIPHDRIADNMTLAGFSLITPHI